MVIISFIKRKWEVISYLFFGGLTTLVNFVAYIILVELTVLNITVSNLIAWVIAVTFAFVTNKLWVFGSKSWEPKLVIREAGIFLGARVATGVIDIVGMPLLFYIGLDYPLFGVDGFLAKSMIGVIVIILNYVFSKLFVFRKKRVEYDTCSDVKHEETD